MPFEDLAAFVRPGITLPWAGRAYYVPPPNARDGLWMQALMDGTASAVLTRNLGAANKAVLSDEQERTLYQTALGPAFDEMSEHGVPWPIVKHAGITAWFCWTRGEDVAENHWTTLMPKQVDEGKAEEPAPTGPGLRPVPSTRRPA
jgi:hypothetical protein